MLIVSHVRLCDPLDCSPPGSSIQGVLQTRMLEWLVIPFSRYIMGRLSPVFTEFSCLFLLNTHLCLLSFELGECIACSEIILNGMM